MKQQQKKKKICVISFHFNEYEEKWKKDTQNNNEQKKNRQKNKRTLNEKDSSNINTYKSKTGVTSI